MQKLTAIVAREGDVSCGKGKESEFMSWGNQIVLLERRSCEPDNRRQVAQPILSSGDRKIDKCSKEGEVLPPIGRRDGSDRLHWMKCRREYS